jgi:uncharacterized protein involved in cysteine biosynthesis
MEKVLKSAINGISDLTAPGMLKLFLLCVGLTTLAAATALGIGIWLVDDYVVPLLPTEDEVSSGIIYWLMHVGLWMFAIAALIMPVFLLFWSFMIFIASFFDEYIAEKIEDHRYPELAKGNSPPFWREFWQDVRFTIWVAFVNLLLVLIPIFWPFWPILFPAVNGYLLGKYFFRMAGGRHVGRKAAGEIASEHRFEIFIAGLAIVFASTIPFLNLLVPFWGVAMMVHLYHMIAKPTPVEVLPPQTEAS